MKGWFSYLLSCRDGSLYSGFTVDMPRRLSLHNAGKGARYTAGHRPVRLSALWQWPDRRAAMSAEALVKRLSRDRKIQLVRSPGAIGNFIGLTPIKAFSTIELAAIQSQSEGDRSASPGADQKDHVGNRPITL